MALGYVGLDLMLMDNNINLDRRVERQLLRMAENPFDLTNGEFKQLYRLTPDIVFNLIDVLEPQLQRTRINDLSVEKQVIYIVIKHYLYNDPSYFLKIDLDLVYSIYFICYRFWLH